MDEVRKPELAEAIAGLAGPFAQVGSDAARRLYEQGQSVAKTISDWNTEVSHFLNRRMAQNGEALGRITKCQNLPEAFAIQAQWVQNTADDYLNEISKLMDVNSRIMSGLLGSAGQVETRPVADTRVSSSRSQTESRRATVSESAA
jgi:hypothetical protein